MKCKQAIEKLHEEIENLNEEKSRLEESIMNGESERQRLIER